MDVFVEPPRRRPRFCRAEQAPTFQLTERDVEIVSQVAHHRFLRSSHLSRLLGAPHQKICERLALLFHAGFLDRPRSQLQYYVRRGGSEYCIYGLGACGARLLRDRDGSSNARPDWTRKNNDVTHQFLQHTLAIADVRVGLVVACRNHPSITLKSAEDLFDTLPEETRLARTPWGMRVPLRYQDAVQEVAVVPDFVFALMLSDGRRRPYMIECDRGTMPIERSRPQQTSMLRKLLAYEAGARAAIHTARFGWKNFRVLIVTTSNERIKNMQKVIETAQQTKGSPLFLFANHSALVQSDILAFPWQDSTGRQRTLI